MSIEKDGVGLIVVPEIHAQSARCRVTQMNIGMLKSGFVPLGGIASGVGHQDSSRGFLRPGQDIEDPVIHFFDEVALFRRAVVVVLRDAVDAPEHMFTAIRRRDALTDRGAVEHFRNGDSFSFYRHLVAGKIFELDEKIAVGESAADLSAAGKKHALIIVRIEDAGAAGLFELVQASGGLRPFPRLVERRQQHGGKNGDDRDYDQEFDKSK